jgi:hypothetical protein
VNPEEAEIIIALIYSIKTHPTHILTYSAPVTRKMLHFNDLKYYALPELPKEWIAPSWLTIELGIFAGRLYFEYDEGEDLFQFLGLDVTSSRIEEKEDTEPTDWQSSETGEDSADEEAVQPAEQSFTEKPLTFLREWLIIRRKGQDFAHTPMGYVCQGKSLSANHPFFTVSNELSYSKAVTGDKRTAQGLDGMPVAESPNREVTIDEDGYEDDEVDVF